MAKKRFNLRRFGKDILEDVGSLGEKIVTTGKRAAKGLSKIGKEKVIPAARFVDTNLPLSRTRKIGLGIALDIARAPGRAVGSVGIGPASEIIGLATGRKAPKPIFQPKTKIAKFLLGDKPIKAIDLRAQEIQEVSSSFAKARGFSSQSSEAIGFALSPLLVGGFTALDLTPLGGGSKASTTTASKLVGRYGDDIVNMVSKLRTGNADDIAKLPTTIRNDVIQSIAKARISVGDLERALIQLTKKKPTAKGAVTRQSKLLNNIIKSPAFDKGVGEKLKGTYKVITNKQTVSDAVKFIGNDLELAKSNLLNKQGLFNRVDVASAKLIAERLTGQQQLDFMEAVTKKATELGQAAQAFAIWGRLTPEGALKLTMNTIDKAKKEAGRFGNVPNLTEEAARAIIDQATEIKRLLEAGKEGTRLHIEAVGRLQTLMAVQIPPSLGEKVSTIQVMAQLLNPKTFSRNVIGNTAFAGLENLSQVAGAAVDIPLSKLTGVKSLGLPSLGRQIAGFKRGGKEGFRDVKLGIDTANLPTRFDLSARPIFGQLEKRLGDIEKTKLLKKVEVFGDKALGALEKGLAFSLKVPDRAAFQAAYTDTFGDLTNLVKINGGELTDDVLAAIEQRSRFEGLRRTFQDNSLIAQSLSGLKRGLNKVSGLGFTQGKFGAGDIIIKYPKTPGNLLSRGIDYSPIRLMSALFDIASLTIPAGRNLQKTKTLAQLKGGLKVFGNGKNQLDDIEPLLEKIFTQRRLVEKTTKSVMGTAGIVGVGALLHNMGIMSGQRPKDKDIADLDRQSGLNNFRLNLTALKRWALTGFQDPKVAKPRQDDIQVSYDWFQPMSIGLAMGANIDANKGEKGIITGLLNNPEKALEILGSGVGTILEQPSVRGLKQLAGAVTFAQDSSQIAPNILKTLLKETPASFMPTLLGHIAFFNDQVSRETKGNTALETAKNKLLNKIPGFKEKLPARFGSLGEEIEFGQDSLLSKTKKPGIIEKIFNQFFNPAFIERIKFKGNAKFIKDLIDSSGDETVAPRIINQSQSGFGESWKLNGEQISGMQEVSGKVVSSGLDKLKNNKKFNNLSDENKVKVITSMFNDIAKTVKIDSYLDHMDVKVSSSLTKKERRVIVEDIWKDKSFKRLNKTKQATELRKRFDEELERKRTKGDISVRFKTLERLLNDSIRKKGIDEAKEKRQQ